MIVVADTSPLNYVVQLEVELTLSVLYSTVLIPKDVLNELQAAKAPSAVWRWAMKLPGWVKIMQPDHLLEDPSALLDQGERAAIQLALEASASLMLMDDWKAVQVAKSLGLDVIGTVGVLRIGHRAGLIDGREAYMRLRRTTNFRCSETIALTYLGSLGQN